MTYIVYSATHIPSGLQYVGMTSQTLHVRMGQHWGMLKSRRHKFHEFLIKTHPMQWEWKELYSVASYKEAREMELHLIKERNLYDTGLNTKTGLARVPKEKILEMNADRLWKPNHIPWNKGKIGVSELTREKMREAKYKNPTRRVFDDADRIKSRMSQKNRKAICCIETGDVFPSITSCAETLKISKGDIRKQINGKRNHVHGFTFKLESEL